MGECAAVTAAANDTSAAAAPALPCAAAPSPPTHRCGGLPRVLPCAAVPDAAKNTNAAAAAACCRARQWRPRPRTQVQRPPRLSVRGRGAATKAQVRRPPPHVVVRGGHGRR